jgi:hypothetical protein
MVKLFNVRDYGAVGDYDPVTHTFTDDTVAFRKAWMAAIASAKRINVGEGNGWSGQAVGIYVPTGFYHVDVSSDVLVGSGTVGEAIRGLDIYGDGPHNSVVYLEGDQYFVHNTNAFGFFKFRSIGFVGITGKERLMKMSSSGTAQAVDRFDVFTSNLGQLYFIDGGANADYCSHVLCNDNHYSKTIAFIEIGNPQSVQHTFSACHALTYSTYLLVHGGGNIFWYGGGVLVFGTDKFIRLDDSSGTGIGTLNAMYSFNGMHTEFHDSSGMLYCNAVARIVFRDCDFMVHESPGQIGFQLDSLGSLTLDHCGLDMKVQVNSNESTFARPDAAFVHVKDCYLVNLPENLFATAHPFFNNAAGRGKAKFTNCRVTSSTGVSPHTELAAADCYINYDVGFDHHTRTPNVICLQGSANEGRGLPNATPYTFNIAAARAFIYMIKIVTRVETPQRFVVSGPVGLNFLAVSAPLQRYSTSHCDIEVTSSDKLTVTNLTDDNFADGYVLVFYI